MIIAFEHCVWRIEFELFSEKLFVILTLVTISKVIYEIIWFIELWFVFRFASLIVFRSLKLKIIFSMNETSISNFFRDALMIARKVWFEFWVAISNIISEISLFICALIIALSFSKILSIFFVLTLFAFAFAIRMFSIVFSIVFIVLLFAILRWLVEKMFSLMIEIMILRLRDREIDVTYESIELMMFWICWVIWSLKFRSVFWFFSLICDIKFNCQSKFTFFADWITSWRFFSEIDEFNCQLKLTFFADFVDRITNWTFVIWDFSKWLIKKIEIIIMKIVKIVKVVIMIIKLINSMFLNIKFLNDLFLSLLLSKKKSVFDDEKKIFR